MAKNCELRRRLMHTEKATLQYNTDQKWVNSLSDNTGLLASVEFVFTKETGLQQPKTCKARLTSSSVLRLQTWSGAEMSN